jgi:hypothetical protein
MPQKLPFVIGHFATVKSVIPHYPGQLRFKSHISLISVMQPR